MRTPQQALKDAIDSGAVQAWIEGKKIEGRYVTSPPLQWFSMSENSTPSFQGEDFIWRVTPPEPPKPTIIDWRPIETCPMDTTVILLYEDGSMDSSFVSAGSLLSWATHWAPLPAPPQGDK